MRKFTLNFNYVKGNLLDNLTFSTPLIFPVNLETGMAGDLGRAVLDYAGVAPEVVTKYLESNMAEVGDIICMNNFVLFVSKDSPVSKTTEDIIRVCFRDFFGNHIYAVDSPARTFIMPKVFCGGEKYPWSRVRDIIVECFEAEAKEDLYYFTDNDMVEELTFNVVIPEEQWKEDVPHFDTHIVTDEEEDVSEPEPVDDTVTVTLPKDEICTFAASLLGKVNHGIDPQVALAEVVERYGYTLE